MPAPRDEPSEVPGLPRFASVVAHELRNPLSAVKIALQTLERHGALPAKDATRLAIALREVGTIERVLTEILDWARPPEVTLQPVRVDELLAAALASARPVLELQHAVVVRPPEGSTGSVLADLARATVALAELVRNAAQSSKPGDPVVLEVRELFGTASHPGARQVEISVLDRGPGIAAEELPLAFDPFFTRRARGVGLGLARARDIAHRHGGEVVLEQTAAGFAARLRLPAAPSVAAP